MPDALHERAAGAPLELGEHLIAGIAIAPAGFDLHEFVVVQGAARFRDYAFAQAGIAEQDDRLQGVAQAAQVFALFFTEFHPRILPLVERARAPVGEPIERPNFGG